ncbi:hypothetical protein [Solirubrobacter soli]|uniref:hypothetical protein n=1 Tax=Solirubrobacter soli TaxID=363832 RepID=UPI0012F77CEB|nr:hypothetical protein [Solirubrobacter soli]
MPLRLPPQRPPPRKTGPEHDPAGPPPPRTARQALARRSVAARGSQAAGPLLPDDERGFFGDVDIAPAPQQADVPVPAADAPAPAAPPAAPALVPAAEPTPEAAEPPASPEAARAVAPPATAAAAGDAGVVPDGFFGDVDPPASVATPAELAGAVTRAAGRLPQPELKGSAQFLLDPMARAARERGDAARAALGGGGASQVPPPRVPAPFEIDPTPDATETLLAANAPNLPELVLPRGWAPRNIAPTPVKPPTGVLTPEVKVEAPPQPEGKAKEAAAKAGATREAAKTAAEKQPAEAPAEPKFVDPPVLVDFRSPPIPPPAPEEAAKAIAVLGKVLDGAAKDAKAIVADAMKVPFNGTMAGRKLFEHLFDPLVPATEQAFLNRIDELRAAVDPAETELAKQTADRRQRLTDLAAGKVVATTQAAQTTVAAMTQDAAKTKGAIDAKQRREELKRIRRLQAAKTSHDPKLVDELVEERMKFADLQVGDGVNAIKRAATRRRAVLDLYEASYLLAARDADNRAQAGQTNPGDPPKTKLEDRRAPLAPGGELWLAVAEREIHAAFEGLRTATDSARDERVKAIEQAGTDLRAAVRDWAAKRVRKDRTEQERHDTEAQDKARQEQAEKDAEARAATNDTRDRLVQDVRAAVYFHDLVNDKDAGARKVEDQALRDKQKEVAKQYLKDGEDPADPLSVVVAHIRAEFRATQIGGDQAPLVVRLKDIVFALPTPWDRESQDDLSAVIFSDNPPDASTRADRAFKAMDQIGTDEDAVYAALANLTPQQSLLVQFIYARKHGSSLSSDIDDEFSGAEKRRANALLNSQPVAAAAAAIDYARPLLGGPAGKEDKEAILQALRTLPDGQADELVAVYKKQTGDDLRADLKETLADFKQTDQGFKADERGYEQASVLIELNTARATTRDGKPAQPDPQEIRRLQAKADALDFDRGLRSYAGGMVTPRADFDAVRASFDRIRAETEQRNPNWSQDEVDAETRRRMAAMEGAYGQRFGAEVSGSADGKESSLHQVMKAQLRGDAQLQLAEAQLYVDRRAEIAARLQLEAKSGVYSSDDVLNKQMQANFDMAADAVKRSDGPQLRRALQQRMDADAKAGKPWDQDAIDKAEHELDRELERRTQVRAEQQMTEVDARFGTLFGDSWGGREGALERMLRSETQGTGKWWSPGSGETEAMWRLKQGGGLNRGQQILLGVHGYDMDREQVMGGLEGNTAQELVEVDKQFQDASEQLEGESQKLTDRLHEESSGRNRFDIDEALQGMPLTAEERLDAAKRRVDWEKDAYFHGDTMHRSFAAGFEYAEMEAEYKLAKRRYDRLVEARTQNLPMEQRNALQRSFTTQANLAVASADAYRARVDSYVDTFTQIVAAAAAITVAIAITVATAGTAAPALVALAASLAGTGATIISKAYLLDKAYGIHELKTDAIIGTVDALASVATAGIGDKLLGVSKATGATKVALKMAIKQAALERAAKPLLARLAAQGIEQIAQAAPSALMGNVLNRQNWHGDMFKNIVTGTATQIGTGMVVGAGIGGVMHVGGMALAPVIERLRGGRATVMLPAAEAALRDPAALPRDSLLLRGTPEQRMAAFRDFKKSYPLASLEDFRLAVKRGEAVLTAAAEDVHATKRALRTEMLADIPPTERKRFGATPIEILTDAEFTARTGSEQKGIAAVLIVDGKATVVVREGAPPGALRNAMREEGLHLRQVADPANATRVILLDEGRLGRWPELPLEERMASWQAKLDLEIEAQQHTLAKLESELPHATDPDIRADLESRIEFARDTHAALETRLHELRAFDPGARLPGGEGVPPPKFTEEPPRLFGKLRDAKDSPSWRPGMNATETARWTERWPDGTPRRYRRVRLYDPATGGKPITFEEIRMPDGSWRKRGSESVRRGRIMELVSRTFTETRAAALPSNQRHVPLNVQNASSQGFDEVVFKFERDNAGRLKARVGVVEVKDYPGRYVPAADFTAIDDHMRQNLLDVQRRMNELGAHGLGMTKEEFKVAQAALKNRHLDVEIRLGPDTYLGKGANAATLPRLLSDLRRRYGTEVTVNRMNLETGIAEAKLANQRLEARTGSTRFAQLADTPGGMTPKSILAADTVMKAERGSVVNGPCDWAPGREYLHDKAGKPVVVEALVGGGSFDVEATAKALLERLDEQRLPLKGTSLEPVTLVVDRSSLTPGQRLDLIAKLDELARGSSQGQAYEDRLKWVGRK